MRSSQAARGLLTAVGRAAAATGADRGAFRLESDGVVTSSFTDFSLSGVAFLAVNGAAALEAGSAARTALPAAEAAGRGANADSCGPALLADAMAASGPAAALGRGRGLGFGFGFGFGFESSLKATPATASAAKPANSQISQARCRVDRVAKAVAIDL